MSVTPERFPAAAAAGPASAPDAPWRKAVRQMLRNPTAMLGLAVLVVLTLLALTAPWIAPYDPIKQNPLMSFQPPSSQHWLGTDQFGRDILTRLLYGARISLRIGLVAVGIAIAFGGLLGLVSGYYGGWIDQVISRFVDLLLAFPGILLALVIVSVIGPSLTNVMIAVGVAATPTYARVVRGSVLAARENVYVEAAHAVGASDRRVLVQHVLPNVLAPVIVLATLGVAGAILTGAALSFLGLGAAPPTPEWGAMLSEGRGYMRFAWWISTFPGLAIMVAVLATNLFGDGLRDALDPRMRV
jgi:peptide/nickel transport system permease protein